MRKNAKHKATKKLLEKVEHHIDPRANDSQIIQEALSGKQHAFKELMRRYHDAIYHLIYRMIYDKEEIEDLTQETFIKAFASLSNFNDQYAFSTWLYKIATNHCIDYIRKRKLQTFSINKGLESEEQEYSYELPDPSSETDKTLIEHQRKSMINEAIDALPEKYRRVIILRHREEKDYQEIAKIVHLPVGTVKAHLFRGRELLNRYLRKKIRHY